MMFEPNSRPEVAYRLIHRRSQHRSFKILQIRENVDNVIQSDCCELMNIMQLTSEKRLKL